LFEGPVDAGGDLGGADGSCEVGALGEAVHQVTPRFGAALPGVGVGYRVDEGHDAVADEGHGGEVLCAGWCRDEHSGLEGVSGCCVVCWVCGGMSEMREYFGCASG
jgi:hypothetical protein